MNISIFGLGYVGVVSAACLASRGHNIIGVDIDELKVRMLDEGLSPIVEKDVPELLATAKNQGLLSATTKVNVAMENTEVSIICVGTPGRANGSLNTEFIEKVCEQIGTCLKQKSAVHTLLFRSTMLPGTMRKTVIPIVESCSGKKHNIDFHSVYNPEFLRESSAVYDFNNPPKTVIGADSEEAVQKVLSIYDNIQGPIIKTKMETAEMVKYIDNNFHALKITFANEAGCICKSLGMDSHEVMNIMTLDTKLNISPAYLKPGFAFGGSCLPKDLRAMNYLAKTLDVETPLLNSLIPSNNSQISSVIKRVTSYGKNKIGIAGFSFKEGTDDLRESPMIEVIETLLGKGYNLKLYDPNVTMSKTSESNKEYLENSISHISYLMVDSLDELLKDRELIILGNRNPEFKSLLSECREDQIIFDLVRMKEEQCNGRNYEGIYW
jgi:GDP-mannose 6-dehydrogenase